ANGLVVRRALNGLPKKHGIFIRSPGIDFIRYLLHWSFLDASPKRVNPKILQHRIQRQVNRFCDCSRLRKTEKVLRSSEKVHRLHLPAIWCRRRVVLVGMSPLVSRGQRARSGDFKRSGSHIEAWIEPCWDRESPRVAWKQHLTEKPNKLAQKCAN